MVCCRVAIVSHGLDTDLCTQRKRTGRVLAILAVARSFGDHGLKQFVSARPHITITEIGPEHEFVALCCDGIFDVMEDTDVVDFIHEHSQNGAFGESVRSASR